MGIVVYSLLWVMRIYIINRMAQVGGVLMVGFADPRPQALSFEICLLDSEGP